jgi:hypothetical protein
LVVTVKRSIMFLSLYVCTFNSHMGYAVLFLWGPIKGKVIHNIQRHNSHMYDTPRYNQLKIIGILYIPLIYTCITLPLIGPHKKVLHIPDSHKLELSFLKISSFL